MFFQRPSRNLLITLRDAITHTLPPACAGCDGHAPPRRAFCALCDDVAYPLQNPLCAVCSVPMEQFSSPDEARSECSRCRRRPPNFDRIIAHWEYDGAVADAIRRLKYGDDFASLRALCRGARPWFLRCLCELPEDCPIIPVPSHSTSLRRRGFHVPTMSLHLLLPRRHRHRIDHRLVKSRSTPRQAGLPFAARQANVRDVFAYRASTTPAGAAILFDDVVTTGATVDAAADVLKAHGFDGVHVITLARAPRHRTI